MRVLFLQQQPCVRAHEVRRRPAPAQVELGLRLSRPHADRALRRRRRAVRGAGIRSASDPAAALPEIVEAFAPDVIHSPQPPRRLTVLALDMRPAGPGDPRRPRHAEPAPDALRGRLPRARATRPSSSAGRSEECGGAGDDLARAAWPSSAARYTLPRHVVAFANYALGRDLPRELRRRRRTRPPRLVYQGTLSTNGGHYDLRDLFAAIAEQGDLARRLHGARGARVPRDPGHPRATTRCPRPRCCASSSTTTSAGRASTPASTAPTSTPRCPTSSTSTSAAGCRSSRSSTAALRRMLGEEGVGIALDDVGELASALASADVAGLRRRVAERRERYTVESQISAHRGALPPIVGAARGALGTRRRRGAAG